MILSELMHGLPNVAVTPEVCEQDIYTEARVSAVLYAIIIRDIIEKSVWMRHGALAASRTIDPMLF